MDTTTRKSFDAAGVVELEPRTEFSLYCDWLAVKFEYYLNFGTVDQAHEALLAYIGAGC